MLSNHLIHCCCLILPSVFPSIRVFSKELALHIGWPNYWSFSFSISPSHENSWLISLRIDWFNLLAVWSPLCWEHRVLATGPPGKSLDLLVSTLTINCKVHERKGYAGFVYVTLFNSPDDLWCSVNVGIFILEWMNSWNICSVTGEWRIFCNGLVVRLF